MGITERKWRHTLFRIKSRGDVWSKHCGMWRWMARNQPRSHWSCGLWLWVLGQMLGKCHMYNKQVSVAVTRGHETFISAAEHLPEPLDRCKYRHPTNHQGRGWARSYYLTLKGGVIAWVFCLTCELMGNGCNFGWPQAPGEEVSAPDLMVLSSIAIKSRLSFWQILDTPQILWVT